MAKINEIDITSLLFQEGAAPTTPASTKWRAYFKTDGLYIIDDAGTETGPLGTGGGGGMTLIDSWVHSIDGNATAVTFSGIASSYTDLILVGSALRADDSGASSQPTFRVGNTSVDTGSNYGYGWHNTPSTRVVGNSASATSIDLGAVCAGSGATAGHGGDLRLVIPRYASTGLRRGIHWTGFLQAGVYATQGSGEWRGTTAIDVVSLIADAGVTNGFTQGAVYLYGI